MIIGLLHAGRRGKGWLSTARDLRSNEVYGSRMPRCGTLSLGQGSFTCRCNLYLDPGRMKVYRWLDSDMLVLFELSRQVLHPRLWGEWVWSGNSEHATGILHEPGRPRQVDEKQTLPYQSHWLAAQVMTFIAPRGKLYVPWCNYVRSIHTYIHTIFFYLLQLPYIDAYYTEYWIQYVATIIKGQQQ